MTAESLHLARPLRRETADVAHAVAHLPIYPSEELGAVLNDAAAIVAEAQAARRGK